MMDAALRAFVRERAGRRCEYCRLDEDDSVGPGAFILLVLLSPSVLGKVLTVASDPAIRTPRHIPVSFSGTLNRAAP